MFFHRFRVIVLLLAASATASAQTSDSTHFIIGASYNSGLNYYGRVDSLHSKAYYPFVGIAIKNGLYVNASFVFVHNSLQSQYAATLLEGGYNFKSHKGNWAGNLSATRFFYQQDIDLVQSAIREMASVSLSNLNKVLNITIGANIKWSDKADIGAQAGVDHIFRFPAIFGKGILVLDPSANVFAGTQNFTRSYYEQKNLLFLPVDQQQVTTTTEQFNVLAYEVSLPIVYGYKKMNLIFTPAYVMPQNLIVVPGQPQLSENGANLLYVTVSAKFTL